MEEFNMAKSTKKQQEVEILIEDEVKVEEPKKEEVVDRKSVV